MARDLQALLEEAKALNSKVFSLPRLELMALLAYYHPEGVPFRDLKAHLGMADGKLLSNVYALREMGYINSEEEKAETKILTTYTMTPEGLAVWEKSRAWLKQWLAST
jgi:DNA-binding MarR family transcriptional regulator